MPAGVSWAVYLRHCSAAMLAMLAGSQTVHIIYKPLEVSSADKNSKTDSLTPSLLHLLHTSYFYDTVNISSIISMNSEF